MKRVCMALAMMICLGTVQGQSQTSEPDWWKWLENLMGYPSVDGEDEDKSFENLAILLHNPLDINKASADELRMLTMLSEQQIEEFIRYRSENGNLLSVYELQSIPKFDSATLYAILPFISTTGETSNIPFLERVFSENNNYLLTRYERTLEKSQGYSDTAQYRRFQGTPDKLYTRFRTSRPGDFSMGFTGEKDSGEKLAWNGRRHYYGADYFSWHVQLLGRGKLKNLVLGDYQGQFAQGLLLGNLFNMGKGSEPIATVRRANIGFLPYTSVAEDRAFRGMAATLSLFDNLDLHVFYSGKSKDANLHWDSLTGLSFSSFYNRGLHRNAMENSLRKKILEENYGALVQFKKKQTDAGLMYTSTVFGVPLLPRTYPYNQFAFSGKENPSIGAWLNVAYKNISFFSEVARNLNGGWGINAGFLSSLNGALDLAFLFREYQRDFHTFQTGAFKENPMPQNERGFYWGMKYTFSRRLNVCTYYDLFYFPWLRYQGYAPSSGHETLARLNFQPSKSILFSVQVREEKKDRHIPMDEGARYILRPGTKRNGMAMFSVTHLKKLTLKTRIQVSDFTINNQHTYGMGIAQDLTVDVGKLKCSLRCALFDTDDYENRQYFYEKDIWGSYSLPAYYGEGVRYYGILEYTLNQKITCWIRLSQTRLNNRDHSGSGLDQINGPLRHDVKAQFRFRL